MNHKIFSYLKSEAITIYLAKYKVFNYCLNDTLIVKFPCKLPKVMNKTRFTISYHF